MEILENMDAWVATYKAGWLAHFEKTGEKNFKIYNRPQNSEAPAGPGIDLSQSRLILITTAGSYLRSSQKPFQAEDPLGDYTTRIYPTNTQLGDLAIAQQHYNHEAIEDDCQVLIPLRHLEDLVQEGFIGELATNVISAHGYMPDVLKLLKVTIPDILTKVAKEEAHAALLVPA